MLDIKFIRDNLEFVKTAAKNKNREVDWDVLLNLDDRRRDLIKKSEQLRAERNKRVELSSPNLQANLKKGGQTIREQGKLIKEELKKLEDELREVEDKFNQLMLDRKSVV